MSSGLMLPSCSKVPLGETSASCLESSSKIGYELLFGGSASPRGLQLLATASCSCVPQKAAGRWNRKGAKTQTQASLGTIRADFEV